MTQFYQAFSRVSIASNKCWGKKAWVHSRLPNSWHGLAFNINCTVANSTEGRISIHLTIA